MFLSDPSVWTQIIITFKERCYTCAQHLRQPTPHWHHLRWRWDLHMVAILKVYLELILQWRQISSHLVHFLKLTFHWLLLVSARPSDTWHPALAWDFRRSCTLSFLIYFPFWKFCLFFSYVNSVIYMLTLENDQGSQWSYKQRKAKVISQVNCWILKRPK